jgi:DNA-binding transcriptional MerR regulator
MSNADDPSPDASIDASLVARLQKSPTAFRTISEVAEDLHIPQHVLRFWETKFPQVRPLKRGGGRRYYRPDDIALLRRISDLLYIQGYTIKGVQRLLREGDGRLADDIPPPVESERAEAEPEEQDSMQLCLLDGPVVSTPKSEHLRAVLARTLVKLEQLRAKLIPSALPCEGAGQ